MAHVNMCDIEIPGPCPFCGYAADFRQYAGTRYAPAVFCTNDRDCGVVMDGETLPEALDKWARRADLFERLQVGSGWELRARAGVSH